MKKQIIVLSILAVVIYGSAKSADWKYIGNSIIHEKIYYGFFPLRNFFLAYRIYRKQSIKT